MNEPSQPPAGAPAPTPESIVAEPVPPIAQPLTRTVRALAGLLGVAAFAACAVAWRTQDRVQELEQELVRRQQDSQAQAAEAALLARQAQELSRDAVAKATLLDARVAELAIQRSQLEELIRSLTRSRDENLLADIDASVRVALQQTGITGSAEPLLAALKSADERLARAGQPRLEPVRRAIARDIDRTRAVALADLASLAIKLDEGVRLADDVPLLVFEPPRPATRPVSGAAGATPGGRAAPRTAAASEPPPSPVGGLGALIAEWGQGIWSEVAALVRLTRIDQPEAMLLAPDQAFFLRENLKLKLLNARVALLSRQFEIAHADLHAAIGETERHFDRGARQTGLLLELLRGVASQARQGGVPRPDDTLAALAAASR